MDVRMEGQTDSPKTQCLQHLKVAEVQKTRLQQYVCSTMYHQVHMKDFHYWAKVAASFNVYALSIIIIISVLQNHPYQTCWTWQFSIVLCEMLSANNNVNKTQIKVNDLSNPIQPGWQILPTSDCWFLPHCLHRLRYCFQVSCGHQFYF